MSRAAQPRRSPGTDPSENSSSVRRQRARSRQLRRLRFTQPSFRRGKAKQPRTLGAGSGARGQKPRSPPSPRRERAVSSAPCRAGTRRGHGRPRKCRRAGGGGEGAGRGAAPSGRWAGRRRRCRGAGPRRRRGPRREQMTAGPSVGTAGLGHTVERSPGRVWVSSLSASLAGNGAGIHGCIRGCGYSKCWMLGVLLCKAVRE